jgi:ubiquinone biosynthesis protein COQ9
MTDTILALKDRLLDAALDEAAFGGWTRAMLRRAGEAAGLDEGQLMLAAPGGVGDVLDHWAARVDGAVLRALLEAQGLKIRQKATLAVRTRIEAYAPHKEAMRRALITLALPGQGALAARLAWRDSDVAWRAMGDTSTDFNWYTKRTILMGVQASTLAYWMQDASADHAETLAFLDRRIDNVMQFEKVKAQVKTVTDRLPDPVALLTRLRYGPQPRP